MAVQFQIREKGDPDSKYLRSFLRDRIVVGRARLSDICLPDMAVSTRHLEISLKGGGFTAKDLGSQNGTRINGRPLVAHRARSLSDGDVIEVAGFELEFQTGAAQSASEPRDASVRQARKILASILERSGHEKPPPALAVITGPSKGTRYVIPPSPGKIELGRSKDANLILEDRDVSRNHAEIVVEEDALVLSDLKSRNGIYIDGERIESAKLETGMRFRLGNTTVLLEHPIQPSLAAIFEAPEEETSTFSVPAENLTDPENPPEEPTAKESPATQNTLKPKKATSDPPPPKIGPKDPLLSPPNSPLGRTTAHMPMPRNVEPTKSDLGLIIIGGVMVFAAVLALVYLFT